MKLAVSNIAWPADQDAAVAELLAGAGVTGIEVAPTKLWPAPLEATDSEIDACRRIWESRGIPVVAAQALLFGRPELTLFSDAMTRRRTLEYLCGIVRICGRLGAKALVFGSPKNRRAGNRDRAEVWQEAVDFFSRLGESAVAAGTVVAIEANPPDYGADFVTQASEAVRLVRDVNHAGFRLHLDSACMTISADDPTLIIPSTSALLAHFHASEPQLAPIGSGSVDHARFAAALATASYDSWVSVEMRQGDPFDAQALARAVGIAERWYGPCSGPNSPA